MNFAQINKTSKYPVVYICTKLNRWKWFAAFSDRVIRNAIANFVGQACLRLVV